MTDLIPCREQAEVVHLPDPSLAEQMKILALANTKAEPKETIHIEASVQRTLFYIKQASEEGKRKQKIHWVVPTLNPEDIVEVPSWWGKGITKVIKALRKHGFRVFYNPFLGVITVRW